MKTISQFLIILLSPSILWFIPVSKVLSPKDTSQMIECSVFKDDGGKIHISTEHVPGSVGEWFSMDQLLCIAQWEVVIGKMYVAATLSVLCYGISVIVNFIDKKYSILTKDSLLTNLYKFFAHVTTGGFAILAFYAGIELAYLYYFTDL
jgi:hypothetical protein